METIRNSVWATDNQIYFFNDFNDASVNELIKLINKNKNKKDLTINVKSYGGYSDEMWAAVDLVKKHEIRVHVIGYAMSAGFGLFCAAKYRSMEPNAVLMYHQASYGESGTVESHRRRLKLVDMRNSAYRKLAVETGAFTEDELRSHDDKNEDYYIFYDEAIERKLLSIDIPITTHGVQVDKLEVE
jgi:ATP-dependent protease ClpP protease subunit